MSKSDDEKTFLDTVARTYVTSDSPQDRLIKTLALRTFQPFIGKKGIALEFGCCDGFMTSMIARLVEKLVVVDGSQAFIEMAKQRALHNVEYIHSLFEEYSPAVKYRFIFATYVLEHVIDPVGFLQRAGSMLAHDGYLFIVVPNANALSRQLARHMGLIKSIFDLTQNDVNHGHRRVYDRIMLNRDIEHANLRQISQGGLLLKILADFQMDKLIEEDILGAAQQEALYKMGLEYPDLAGSIFSVCQSDVNT